VWFTGLPASGKSTLAHGVELRLLERRRPACVLDAEELRRGVNADLGAEPSERSEALRRTAEVAALVAESGVVALVAVVSARAAERGRARSAHERARLTFLEVYVSTPLEVCERRDPKGLYALARAGSLRGLAGVDLPYEPPGHPDVAVDTAAAPPGPVLDELMDALGFG
jgi:bifunctional enzyme CysN/CysC